MSATEYRRPVRLRMAIIHILSLLATICLVGNQLVQPSSAQESAQETKEAPTDEAGLALLDQATTAKFSVSKLSDLDVVVGLCREALAKGLSADNEQFAKQMITATLYEKAQRLVAGAVQGARPPGWAQQRRLAVSSLLDALEVDPDHAESHLLLARIDQLPGGEIERGRRSADRAVELLRENPARHASALVVRSAFQENLTERLADLDRAIEADPQNSDAWRDRGRIHLINGQTDKAIEDFSKLLEFDQDDLEAVDAIARGLAIQEKYDEALEMVERLVQKRPDSGEPYALRASIRIMQNKFDVALPDLNRAIELDPEDPRNWLSRSRLYEAMKRWDDAISDVDHLLRRSPGLLPALVQKVSLLASQEKFREAAETLRRIIDANPENAELQFQLASLLSAAKEPREAIKVYSQVLETNESSWEAMRGRGDAYLNIGDHAAAVADYEKALAINPDDSGILNNLSWVLATSKLDQVRDGQRALQLAKKACDETDYGQAHILSTLAAAYAELGDFDKAIEWSTKAVEQGEGDTKAQLEKELQSYQKHEPWREMTTVDESKEDDLEITMEDLKLDTAAHSNEPKKIIPRDEPRIPKDP